MQTESGTTRGLISQGEVFIDSGSFNGSIDILIIVIVINPRRRPVKGRQIRVIPRLTVKPFGTY